MLVDQAIIHVKSGKGGPGVVSFRREKYVPFGGPDGGDGGNGGSVYLKTDPNLDTLLDLTGKHHWNAQNGQPGQGKQKHGAAGEDLDIPVPPGTLVYDNDTGELIADLDKPDLRILIAQGGRGGFGNEHFKGPTNRTPRETTTGEPAVEINLRFELKLIADIGLVGLPNAGKSTLLSRISAARPKIADYPFTTLQPNLGIAQLSDFRRMVIADIPGLIEGASQGRGLGHDFLRHIERTRLLLHLIDPTTTDNPTDDADKTPTPETIAQQAKERYETINHELATYSPQLANKPRLIALTKLDLFPNPEELTPIRTAIEKALDHPIHPISAATGQGLPQLLEAAWQTLHPDR